MYHYGIKTRGGTHTQDPLYPEGHPKRIDQDSQVQIEDEMVSSPKKKMSGPGVCVCNSCYNTIIWRAESRTHLSKQTRPSTEHSRKASNVRGLPSRPDDQLRWVLIVRSQV